MSNSYTGTVMVLNASNEPHDRVDFPHAMRMLFRKVAEVVGGDETRPIGPFPWPKVLRLLRLVVTKGRPAAWYAKAAHWHRGGVYIRDRHRCAYCGEKASTLDHVFPKSRGGLWEWLNIVACCRTCNETKGARTPEEAGMVLRYATPYVPTNGELLGLAAAA